MKINIKPLERTVGRPNIEIGDVVAFRPEIASKAGVFEVSPSSMYLVVRAEPYFSLLDVHTGVISENFETFHELVSCVMIQKDWEHYSADKWNITLDLEEKLV